jgi:hypothetical protein
MRAQAEQTHSRTHAKHHCKTSNYPCVTAAAACLPAQLLLAQTCLANFEDQQLSVSAQLTTQQQQRCYNTSQQSKTAVHRNNE